MQYYFFNEEGDFILEEIQIWILEEIEQCYIMNLEWCGEGLVDVIIGEYDYGGLFL